MMIGVCLAMFGFTFLVVYNVFLAPYRDTDLHWRGDRYPAAPEVHLAHLPLSLTAI